MRAEWDRRVRHDYRYWMSDGTASDELMWVTGERDLSTLLSDLPASFTSNRTALDLGCGVGRLLRAASDRFAKVVGADVSVQAIETAKRLLSGISNISFYNGTGDSLSGIESQSIDLVYSFASVGSIPAQVFAAYLTELSRVLRPGGAVRIQLFLGKEIIPCAEDTLGIRCYDFGRFQAACEAAGFISVSARELKMEFEISDSDAGMIAHIVSMERGTLPSADAESVFSQLISSDERTAGSEWIGSETEYQMAVARVGYHLENGDFDQARETLEFAVKNFRNVEPEVLQMLAQLRAAKWDQAAAEKTAARAASSGEAVACDAGDCFERNLQALRNKGFTCASLLPAEPGTGVSLTTSPSGEPVLVSSDTPLDNVEKPRRAAEVWTERTLAVERIANAPAVVIVGIASGYHLEEFLRRYAGKVHLVEPNIEVLRLLVRSRDITALIGRLESLSVTLTESQEILARSGELPEIVIHPQTQLLARSFVDELKGAYYSKRGRKDLRPTIGVVGPLYGGTLPVTHSAIRALLSMNQRVRSFDMSPFYRNYADLEGWVGDKTRRGALEGYYVEMLSQIVLESVAEKPVDIVLCLAQAPLSFRALKELRSRGIITAMWFIEDGRRFTSWEHLAPHYDYFFVIQKDGFPQRVEAAGAGRAIYLPTACDPVVHRPLSAEEIGEPSRWGSQLSFVGAGYNNRQQMFASLANRDFKIWGTEWSSMPPFDHLVQEGGRRIAPEEYVKIFNASPINLNLHSSSERDGVEPNGDFVNPRTFELAACGAFQLVDNRTLMPEVFEVGPEMVTFADLQELESKADYYLAHPAERRATADASRARALRDHTYERRLESMLGYIYADRYEQLQARESSGPWTRTLKAAKEFPELEERLQRLHERGEDPKIQNLIAEIQLQKGKLSEIEMKLLFLWHVRQSVATMNETRAGRG